MNPNHDEHGQFSSGDGGGNGKGGAAGTHDGHASNVPKKPGTAGSGVQAGYRMADGTYVPPRDRAPAQKGFFAKPGFAFIRK